MKKPGPGNYRPAEFARLAGVSVRALHHYDRLRLLRPGSRTPAGYRQYSDADFVRLQQIVTLKFIGFSLKDILRILERGPGGLAAALRLQREALQDKSRRLGWAILAVKRAERILVSGRRPDAKTFQKIIETIHMQTNNEWMKKYYSPEAQAAIAGRAREWTPGLQEKVERDWADLGKDIEAAVARGEDPAGDVAQKLAARHSALVGGFTGGNPAVEEGLKKMYADQKNWPAKFPMPYNASGGEFIGKALEIHHSKSGGKR